MCGISGIVNKNNLGVDYFDIKAITDIIEHRGPDNEGFFLEGNFAIGHRRLAIIDVSLDGNQPMHFDNKYTIVFNGEIYNYLEIKSELSVLGYKFHTKSDTEVILAAYDYWGTKCVNYFNGMWSFSLYDKKQQILFCSRDRFGVKPFYYFNGVNQFVFGSEIKQLLTFVDRSVNMGILLDYLVLQVEEHTDETFFKNVKKLPASHNLIYDLHLHEVRFERYYSLETNADVTNLSLSDSIDLCKKTLIDSIKIRLRSDVNVGTCLSGGLDSSTIAGIAAKEFNLSENFIGIHAKSTEKSTDESEFAELVAKNGNINLILTEPSEDYFLSNIDKVTYIQEEPYGGPSLFMQYAVFEKAKEQGCIVMLDGQGGDETLLGYERYFTTLLNGRTLYQKIVEMYKFSRKSRLSLTSVIKYYFYFKSPNLRKWRLFKKYNFIKKHYLSKIDSTILFSQADAYKSPFELQKLEITRTQLPHLLKYEDKNSMANSIESRLPFLDYRFVENALSFNPHFKINEGWSKFILRKSTEDYLPPEIGWRRDKKGFESPTNWLKNRDIFMSTIRESPLLKEITINIDETLSDDIVWRLFSVAIWEKTFNVKLN